MAQSRILEYILRVKDEATAVLEKAGRSVSDVGSSMIKIGAAPAAALAFATKSAIDFEDSMANVRKTTGATEEQLQAIGNSILDISTKSRTSAAELVKIATIGGQMGVAATDVIKFTDAIDKVAVALSDEFSGGAEEVTQQMGVLRNLFSDIKTDQIDKDILHIANAVNELGAAGLATGGYMAEASKRIAGVAVPLGMLSSDILGMSATMEELGFNVERGSSAVVRTLQVMSKNVEGFAEVAGMSVANFTDLINTDINQAFISVLEGIQKINPSATEMSAILEDLELSGVGNAELFLKMAQNTELLAEKQDLAAASLENTNSIMSEFNVKNETTAAQFEKLMNHVNRLGIIIGNVLLPPLNDLIDKMMPVIESFANFAAEHPKLVTGLLGVVAALVPLGTALKLADGFANDFKKIMLAFQAFNKIIPVFTGLSKAIGLMGGAAKAAFAIIAANPIIIVIGLIVGALILLYKVWTGNWGGIQDKTKEVFDWMKQKIEGFVTWMKELPQKISDIFTGMMDLIFAGDYTRKLGQALGVNEDSPLILGILGLREKIIETWNSITEFFSTLPERIGSMIDAIINWFLSLPEKIAYALGFLVGTFFNWADQMWVFFTETIPMWIESIVIWFSELPEKISVWLTDLYNKFVAWGTATWEYLMASITYWLDMIVSWFAQLPGRIWTWLTDLYNRFVAWGKNTWSYLSENIPKWLNQIVEWMRALPGRVWESLSELYAKVKSRFEEAWKAIVDEIKSWPGKLLDWGKKIAEAFVNGVKEGLKNLKDAFMRGFEDARGSIEGKSPPKEGVFKNIDVWGYNVGQAWVDGFKQAINGLDMPPVAAAGAGVYPTAGGNTTNAPIHLTAVINNEMDAYELAHILGFELDMMGRAP